MSFDGLKTFGKVVAGIVGSIALFLLCSWGMLAFIGSATGMDRLSDEEIAAGRPCTAKVLSITDTNNLINERTVFEFKLEVKPEDGSAYEATIRDTVSEIEAVKVANPDSTFKCVIDRNDSTRVAVFWS